MGKLKENRLLIFGIFSRLLTFLTKSFSYKLSSNLFYLPLNYMATDYHEDKVSVLPHQFSLQYFLPSLTHFHSFPHLFGLPPLLQLHFFCGHVLLSGLQTLLNILMVPNCISPFPLPCITNPSPALFLPHPFLANPTITLSSLPFPFPALIFQSFPCLPLMESLAAPLHIQPLR